MSQFPPPPPPPLRPRTLIADTTSAIDTQIDGDHYKNMAIQPMTFCMSNRLDYATSNVIKYVTRRKGDKDKRAIDLRKAIHCIQLLAAHEGIEL